MHVIYKRKCYEIKILVPYSQFHCKLFSGVQYRRNVAYVVKCCYILQ